jgi:AcrR family transcriptional regulator
MNDSLSDTASDLVAAATELFSHHGYEGTSVRAITSRAGTNLGAITYHFGSKDALYEAAFAAVVEPSVQYLTRAASGIGTPLQRIERFVRAFFEYLHEHPELPRLLVHHLAGARPMPEPGRRTMRGNVGLLSQLIAAGQRDGSVRGGDPFLMALSVGAQPMFLSLTRQALMEGASLDQDDPGTREQLVESVVLFVRRGLTQDPGGQE